MFDWVNILIALIVFDKKLRYYKDPPKKVAIEEVPEAAIDAEALQEMEAEAFAKALQG